MQDNKKQLANTQELEMKNIIPEDILSDKARIEMDKIIEIEKTVDRENFVYRQSDIHVVLKSFKQ